jgi:hypothetical protein
MTKLSNTNTDALCCDTTSNGVVRSIRTFVYRFNLWTGLYMLEKHEQWAFLLAGWFCTSAFLLYIGVFSLGFLEGFRAAMQGE